jgi:hypothetical protein
MYNKNYLTNTRIYNGFKSIGNPYLSIYHLILIAKQAKSTRVGTSKPSSAITARNPKAKVVKTSGSTVEKSTSAIKGANYNKSQS